MMPTIRIDDDVWAWLKSHAQPFEDTPNSVLRRLAGLDQSAGTVQRHADSGTPQSNKKGATSARRQGGRSQYSGRVYSGFTGRELNDEWKVGARHALFHKDGTYYNHLHRFPGALFDLNGYVRFNSEDEYLKSRFLQHGQQLHVPGGISSVPGYVRVRKA